MMECLVPSEVLNSDGVASFVTEIVLRNGSIKNRVQSGKQEMLLQTTLQWATRE